MKVSEGVCMQTEEAQLSEPMSHITSRHSSVQSGLCSVILSVKVS
jgi:hypothetical protein